MSWLSWVVIGFLAGVVAKSVNRRAAPGCLGTIVIGIVGGLLGGALFKAAGTPQKMAALGESKIRDYIKTIGLYRMKAKNVAELSRRLVSEFGGKVPRTHEELESLPGVGRKTANVVMNIAFGEPTIAVDTHIFRVSNRTGLAPGKNVLEVELGLLARVPDEFKLHAHHWLILHGRYVCKARLPDCPNCLINDLCHWPEKRV